VKRPATEIAAIARELLAAGKIDLFIGYRQTSSPVRTTPCFLTPHDDVTRLVWNGFCSNNLAVYLTRMMGRKRIRVGVVAKGCDSRSIANLIRENQISREALVIVGMACPGMLDVAKVRAKLADPGIEKVEEIDGQVIVSSKGAIRSLARTDCLYDGCIGCRHPTPTVVDRLVGAAAPDRKSPVLDSTVRDFLVRPRAERWQIFESELAKCIRCHACRNACPNCYCQECFAEQTSPEWLSASNDMSNTLLYHIGRILHQAGRCVECGACARACPANVNLGLFTRLLADEVRERFAFESGISPEQPGLLSTFNADDRQEFMTEPE